MALVERIVKLSKLASTDQTRYHLNGVWISCPKEGEILLQVTDGHKAARATLTDKEIGLFEGAFFIPLEKMPILKLLLKISRHIQPQVRYDGAQDRLEITVLGESPVYIVRDSGVTPPNFNSFYVLYDDQTATKTVPAGLECEGCTGQPLAEVPKYTVIGFNAKYLMEIVDALKDGNNPTVKLIIKDSTSPITIHCSGREAILMPCRV